MPLQEIVLTGKVWSGEEALRRGLTDELADPAAVLPRTLEVAAELAMIPTASYAATKSQLRAPVMERIRKSDDSRIAPLWRSPEIHAAIRAYLQKTIGK